MPPPRYFHFDGFLLPGTGFSYDSVSSGLSLPAQPNDVFVCSYPDCGTNWVLRVLFPLLHDDVEPRSGIENVIPHLELHGRELSERMAASLKAPRLFKTHVPYKWTPQSSDAKYICIIRNPKDTALASYYRTRECIDAYQYENGQWEDYFELFMSGQVPNFISHHRIITNMYMTRWIMEISSTFSCHGFSTKGTIMCSF